MAEVKEIARRVWAQSAKDHNAEEVAFELLDGREFDEFDRRGIAAMCGVAWAVTLADNPFISEDELRETTGKAAMLAFHAGYTVGGWEAMQDGKGPEGEVA